MKSAQPLSDLELHEAFEIILSIGIFSDYISDIAELIYTKSLSRESLNNILKKYNITKIEDIKEELLDLLIVYINLVLNDHVISLNEKQNVELLKIYFKIKEGDFSKFRLDEIEDILHRQFEKLYQDNTISFEEELYKVELQSLFGLSYDEFDKFKGREVRRALNAGSDISELSTARFPKIYREDNTEGSRTISQQVKDLVWNRNRGQCSLCGSNEKLEFDYIVPFSKGGSNTYRNIQLLCETCNRKNE